MLKQVATAVALMALAAPLMAEEIEIGAKAPDFKAVGVDGKTYTLADLAKKSEVVVLTFTCNDCPVARAYENRFIDFTKQYKDKGVTFFALNCNTQTENLDVMKARAEEQGFNFVYAYDASGKAAKAYGARVTPHLFVVKDGKVVYRGAFDDRQSNPSEPYLVNAVDALLKGEQPEVQSTKAFGCGIKAK